MFAQNTDSPVSGRAVSLPGRTELAALPWLVFSLDYPWLLFLPY